MKENISETQPHQEQFPSECLHRSVISKDVVDVPSCRITEIHCSDCNQQALVNGW